MQSEVLKLAKKITDILDKHSNPHEAEAACSIARELASLKVRQASSFRLRVNQSLK